MSPGPLACVDALQIQCSLTYGAAELYRIIEPITSRCSKFRFKPLDSSNALARLQAICENEKVPHEPGALEALIQISDGDLRKAITFLQSASKLLSAGAIPGADDETGNKMTVASVREIGGVLPESLLRRLTKAMGVPDLPEEQDDDDAEMNGSSSKKAKSPFDQVRSAVIQLAREGYSATQALSQVSSSLEATFPPDLTVCSSSDSTLLSRSCTTL